MHHGGPFDRFLIAQAQAKGLVLVTRDARIPLYGVRTLAAWARVNFGAPLATYCSATNRMRRRIVAVEGDSYTWVDTSGGQLLHIPLTVHRRSLHPRSAPSGRPNHN